MNHRVCRVNLHRLTVSHRTTWLVVELTTSDGIVGTGECSDLRPIEAARDLLHQMTPVIGRHAVSDDPRALETRIGTVLGPAADAGEAFRRRLVLGAVLTALCDIRAQMDGVTLSGWLEVEPPGQVDLYANINRAPVDRSPAEFARVAASAVEAGFRRIKLAPFDGPALEGSSLLETGIAHLRAVRAAIGDDPTVFVDVHHRLTEDELEPAVRTMEELRVGWIEDAVDVRQPALLERLAGMTDVPLAGGEQLTEQSDVAALVAGGWLTYLLLDPKYIGGPLRFRDMLTVVDDVTLTLHDPTGPVSTAVSAHLARLAPDSGPLEYAYGENVDRSAVVVPGENRQGDRLVVSRDPGIGVRLSDTPPVADQVETWHL